MSRRSQRIFGPGLLLLAGVLGAAIPGGENLLHLRGAGSAHAQTGEVCTNTHCTGSDRCSYSLGKECFLTERSCSDQLCSS